MYENWKIKKSDLDETLAKEQEAVAEWCNQNQQYQINDDDEYIFVEKIPEPTKEELIEKEISQLKQYLADTDWAIIKILECDTEEERQILLQKYSDIISQRKNARKKINNLTNE